MAEIGIILATYNGEKYLREQLDSILSNTFKYQKFSESSAARDIPVFYVLRSG